MKISALKFICYLLIVIGGFLTIVNIYGLNKSIRPQGLSSADLRFKNDITLNYKQVLQSIRKDQNEDEYQYVNRLTKNIANGLAHIQWDKETDASRFHQLIPIWENYFLYFMGIFSGIPEFEKYHYADYERSLNRGIGICGDASIIMSQILDKQGIKNQIISFPGHVIVAVQYANGSEIMYDPDFGVTIPYTVAQVHQSPALIKSYYLQQDYSKSDADILSEIYAGDFERWNGVSHFITKKYYFEIIAYYLKWPLPIVIILASILILRKCGNPPLKKWSSEI